jgi:VWFA-related protein
LAVLAGIIAGVLLIPAIAAPAASGGNPALQTEKPAQKPELPAPPPPQNETSKPPPQNEDQPLRLTSRLVLVPVSASDANGRPVRDLKLEDIVIEEEGRPQKVQAFGEPGKTPVEIGLLFDVSGSIKSQFDFEKQAAVQFMKEVLKPGDAISVFSIGLTPKLTRERTVNAQEAIDGLETVQPSREATAFFDTVVDAAHYLDKSAAPGSRRVLVVISDGEENFSKTNTLNDALREVQKTDCLFYSINPTGQAIRLNVISERGQANMEALATQTGGVAFNLNRPQDLAYVFRQIIDELQAQYLFGYYAGAEQAPSGFRKITVRAPNRSDLRIRARQGYYVGKEQHTP